MAELKHFTPRTTENIERANRLLAFKSSPAFNEIFRLSTALVDEATAALVDYGGWDKDQIAVLKARAQAAKEYHQLLFTRMAEIIAAGVMEAKEGLGESASNALRDQVLRKSDGDTRPSGSY